MWRARGPLLAPARRCPSSCENTPPLATYVVANKSHSKNMVWGVWGVFDLIPGAFWKCYVCLDTCWYSALWLQRYWLWAPQAEKPNIQVNIFACFFDLILTEVTRKVQHGVVTQALFSLGILFHGTNYWSQPTDVNIDWRYLFSCLLLI